MFALILMITAACASAQSNNVYDSNVRPPARSSHHQRYIYYLSDTAYQVEDDTGEIHFIRSHLHRFDPATHRSESQLGNGRWVEP
jgi:hypothetical protein